jgi:hypothetical protein
MVPTKCPPLEAPNMYKGKAFFPIFSVKKFMAFATGPVGLLKRKLFNKIL